MALRRGLWHIFDNLLNNIYKYAQAGPPSLSGFIKVALIFEEACGNWQNE